MLKIFSVIGLILMMSVLTVSCDSKQSQKKKEDNLAKEVIEIHDDVMPKMDDIYKLKKQLKMFLPDSNQVDMKGIEVATIYAQIETLDMAHDAMMIWMREYNGGVDLYTHAERMQYLEKEKIKIIKVRDLMLEAIEESSKLLDFLNAKVNE